MSEEHPAHYNKGKIEVWEFIADQGLGFLEGNIIKYVCRYRFKGTAMRDLLKAKNYLDRLIMERACFEAEVDAKAAEFKRQFEATAPPPVEAPLTHDAFKTEEARIKQQFEAGMKGPGRFTPNANGVYPNGHSANCACDECNFCRGYKLEDLAAKGKVFPLTFQNNTGIDLEAGELIVKDQHGNLVPWVPSQGETEIPLTLEVFFGEKPEGTI